MTPAETVVLGETAFVLDGEHPARDLIVDELVASMASTTPRVHVRFAAKGLPETPRSAAVLGPVTATKDAAWLTFEKAGFRAHIQTIDEGGAVVIDVEVGRRPIPYRLPARFFRWFEPTHMTPIEAQAYVILLRLIEGSVFLYGEQTALLHAACVERDGRAVALASTGGVGKTSTAARLLARPGWRYLADDIVPVTPERAVSYYPRRVMVYGYNADHDPDLRRRLLDASGRSGRLQWRALELARVDRRRRRLPAAVLYGPERVGTSARLDVVAFLSRRPDGDVTVDEIESRDLARRCRSVMANEQAELGRLLRFWEAAGTPPVTFEAALDRHARVYDALFSEVPTLVHVGIPESMTPDDVADAVEALGRGR